MAHSVTTFLMFEGAAEEAMNFYTSLFQNSAINAIERYGEGEMGKAGTVKRENFTVASYQLTCIDSPIKHAFTFTPAISLFVECESEVELENAFSQLATGGSVLMPLGSYGFSTRFGWISDRFGVSWQLNLK